ncbi:MAG: serine hydrolase domain-containing protein [Patescibacteria group bacterium]
MEAVDQVMCSIMKQTGYKAATIAVAYRGKFWMIRGYGWQDKSQTKPINPETRMRIASIDKCFGNACAKELIQQGILKANTAVFPLLGVQPYGSIADARVNQITIQNVIDHKLGWSAENDGFSPKSSEAVRQLMAKSGQKTEPTMRNIIAYMLTRPLDYDPGTKEVYSNFGSVVLRRAVEKAAGMPYYDFLVGSICKRAGITNIALTLPKESRDESEIWYEPESPAYFDCFAISTVELCRFLDKYWISGDSRNSTTGYSYMFYGSLPGTTAIACQRTDGINFAVLFNQRDKIKHEEVADLINKAIDRVSR